MSVTTRGSAPLAGLGQAASLGRSAVGLQNRDIGASR
jgi:hypothetical protein